MNRIACRWQQHGFICQRCILVMSQTVLLYTLLQQQYLQSQSVLVFIASCLAFISLLLFLISLLVLGCHLVIFGLVFLTYVLPSCAQKFADITKSSLRIFFLDLQYGKLQDQNSRYACDSICASVYMKVDNMIAIVIYVAYLDCMIHFCYWKSSGAPYFLRALRSHIHCNWSVQSSKLDKCEY